MSVGIANDDIEYGGINQLEHFNRRTCRRIAQQGETVSKHRSAFRCIFAVRRNAECLRKILLVQSLNCVVCCRTIVAGYKQIGPPARPPPFRIHGVKTYGARQSEAKGLVRGQTRKAIRFGLDQMGGRLTG